MAAQSYAHASASSATLCTTRAAALSRHAGFTPQLAAAYEMANEDEQRFEVVFVSSDESAQAQHRQPLGRLLVHGPCMARAWPVHGPCMEAPASGRAWLLWLYLPLQAQAGYMEEMHGDWLRVPFDSPLRDALKQQ